LGDRELLRLDREPLEGVPLEFEELLLDFALRFSV
jgi:hypothetical protein